MSGSGAVPASSTTDRPTPVAIATVLTLIVAAGNFVFLLPGLSDDVPTAALVVGLVLGIVALPAAFGLWRCQRWGMIATIVVSAINLLFSVPGILFGPSALAIIGAVIGVVLSAAAIVLVLMREARASYL